MTSLSRRTTRLKFVTEDEVRASGRCRKVSVEARPEYAIIRLQGLHTAYTIPWSAIHSVAVKMAVAAAKAEKKAKRGGK